MTDSGKKLVLVLAGGLALLVIAIGILRRPTVELEQVKDNSPSNVQAPQKSPGERNKTDTRRLPKDLTQTYRSYDPEMTELEDQVLREIAENYPDDANVFRWQTMSIVTLASREDIADFVEGVLITPSSVLTEKQQYALRKTAVETLSPIFENSPGTYLQFAEKRGEAIPDKSKDAFFQMIKENRFVPSPSKELHYENGFGIFWKSTIQQSIWSGASPENARFQVKVFTGNPDGFARHIALDLNNSLPTCKAGSWQRYHRIALPPVSAEEFVSKHKKITYGNLRLYIKHQGKSSLTVPYVMQFWLDTTSGQWHPLQMASGSDRDLGRLIF